LTNSGRAKVFSPDSDIVYLLYRFSGLFNTTPKKPNPSPVSIKFSTSGPQAGGCVRPLSPDSDIVYLLYRFSGLFNTTPKKPNPGPVSIKYSTSGPQAGGSVRPPSDSTVETSPGVVDR
jgi:hypothetical protein